MKNYLFGAAFCLFSTAMLAQSSYQITGKVVDGRTQNSLENVEVAVVNTTLSTLTNTEGQFEFQTPPLGNQVLKFSYTDYEVAYVPVEIEEGQSLDLGTIVLNPDMTAELQLGLITLGDNDLGDDNSGSEATSGILQATRDAFQQVAAFSWGQAWYRLRGLDNEYGNVFINGISMNKVLDGRPQFSNWGGLNDAARNQEFISGSQPSEYGFGGILGTQAINMRASAIRTGTRLSLAGANTNYNWRAMATHGSGYNKNGWAYAASAGYRGANEAHFDGTDYDSKSLFLAIEKKINDKHAINLSAIYAQNSRAKNSPNTQELIDLMGYKYNSFWGTQNGKKRNSREKDVEEPIFILSHYWNINNKTRLNTNVSYQFGTIANSRLDYNGANNPDPTYYKKLPSYYLNLHDTNSAIPVWTPDYDNAERNRIDFLANPQIDWDAMYATNQRLGRSVYALYADVVEDKQFSASSLLSTQFSDRIGFNAGVSYRNVQSENYQEMYDLLGGEYMEDVDSFYNDDFAQSDLNNPNRKIYEGDKYGYNFIMHSNVVNVFTQFKFNYNPVNFYLAQSVTFRDFQREGLYRNGLYADSSFGKGEKHSFTNFGLKGGLTYLITGRHILDANLSYYTQAPSIRNSYANSRISDATIGDLQNETIMAADASYIIRTPKFKGRISGYFNQIQDASRVMFAYVEGIGFEDFDNSNEFVTEITTGIQKQNIGLELGAEYQLTQTLKATAAVALGQSTYSKNAQVALNVDGRQELGLNPKVNFGEAFIKNYYLGGIPQKAYSLGLEYRDPDYWWVAIDANLLSERYVDISPLLRTNNFFAEPGQSGAAFPEVNEETSRKLLKQEKLDDAFLLNLKGGKSWRINGKTFGFFVMVNNLLDLEYKTGGFEQLRNANYRELNMDHASGTRTFGNRYFHGFGRTYFLNLYINF